MRAERSAALLVAAALALAGCGREDRAGGAPPPQRGGSADPGLPQPLPDGGAVTGMPARPGPGDVPLGGEIPVIAADEGALLPLEDNPETGLLPGGTGELAAAPAVQAPAPEDGVALLRSYYAALNALDYGRAYGLWSDGGRSSGQSPDQFAAAHAQTSTFMVDIGAPGPVRAAGDAATLEVPVSLRAQQADGTMRRYEGRYVLRTSGVEGTGRRAWRIVAADLRDAAPADGPP
ncbi:hypothetical protein [Luteimonas deserti]|uniref:Uncharacterized protein n=1 Tax=Luteimonas deserti TaxID=2752306 RepID=A0A7Z0QTS2_9GAMM|nr:hypothetical protein [Luteimonas deserti]NYZ63677.1 hypothetical protein [Luteimonas deserti]